MTIRSTDSLTVDELRTGQMWRHVITESHLRDDWLLVSVDQGIVTLHPVAEGEKKTISLGSLFTDYVLVEEAA